MQGHLTKRWFPFKYQVPLAVARARHFYRAQKRTLFVVAGRRSYKTEILKRKLVRSLCEIKRWDDARYFFAAPTQKQAKFIGWADLKRLVPKRWLLNGDRGISNSELRIDTQWGSSLHVVGLDNPERIEGVSWDGGGVTECSDVRWREARLSVEPALMDRHGWMIWEGVPKRWGVGAADFREKSDEAARGEDPEAEMFCWPSSDVMTPEQLRWYQDRWDATDYAEQFGGLWQKIGGGIYHAFDEVLNVRTCHFDPSLVLVIGCDFNVDPMAWIFGHQRGRTLEWFDELWLRNTNTPAALTEAWNRYGQHAEGGILFIGDPAARQRKTSASLSDYQHIATDQRFRDKGAVVRFAKAHPAQSDRFAAVNGMLCSTLGDRRMFFDPGCRHAITDMAHQGYKEGTREPQEGGDVGHMCLVAGTLIETDRGEVPIELVCEGDRVLTRAGYKRVSWSGMTNRSAPIWSLATESGAIIEGTKDHPIYVEKAGFTPMNAVCLGSRVYRLERGAPWRQRRSYTVATSTGGIREGSRGLSGSTSRPGATSASGGCIGRSGLTSTGRYRARIRYTTSTATRSITAWRTLSASLMRSTERSTRRQRRPLKRCELQERRGRLRSVSGISRTLEGLIRRGSSGSPTRSSGRRSLCKTARYASANIGPIGGGREISSVRGNARQKTAGTRGLTTRTGRVSRAERSSESTDTQGPRLVPSLVLRSSPARRDEAVYDLTVEGQHEFFANGILVHNSASLGYATHMLFPLGVEQQESDGIYIVQDGELA